MDPETALELVKRGAALLLLDVPQHTLIGIDTQVFAVGPLFKGMKMIPPGPHFVYYSSCSRHGNEFSPIIGFFIDVGHSELGNWLKCLRSRPFIWAIHCTYIRTTLTYSSHSLRLKHVDKVQSLYLMPELKLNEKNQYLLVIVRQWDQQEEQLIKVSEEEEERYCQMVKSLEFDQHLGPYNLSQYGEWKYLSSYLGKSIIERIEPIGGEITVTCEPEMVKNSHKTVMEKALNEQLRSSKFSTSSTVNNSKRSRCYYTPIPNVIKRRGIEGQMLTALNLDKTELLESVLMKSYGSSEDLLLGELQFAYIAFLMGQSLEGFLQWKSMVSLLLGCIEAPFRTRSQLFTKFIKVIYYQLKFGLQKDKVETSGPGIGISTLLDESWFFADSFLQRLFKDFFLLVQGASVVDGDLLSWTRKLAEMLEKSLGWDFHQNSAVDGMHSQEDDEFAPVVEVLDGPTYEGPSA